MRFEPEVRAHLDAADPAALANRKTMPEQRLALTREIDRMFTLFGRPGPASVGVRDHEAAVTDGVISLRTYHPLVSEGEPGLLPAHILLHGGGWATGSIYELVADATARRRAEGARCVVVLVEYRLAPEHPFPTAVHDAVAALHWVREHASELGIDPAVITLGGASAGANLAAAAIVADPASTLAGLLLEVPALDLRDEAPLTAISYDPDYLHLFRDGGDLAAVRDLYLTDPADAYSPLASPLLAPELSGFPPTRILTGELDPLRAGAELFASRLDQAGVPVDITCYRGALHGSPILTATWSTARQWEADTLAFLVGVHGRTGARNTARMRQRAR